MEIQQGKGPWASPVNGIVPLGTTLTMVVGIDDKEGKYEYVIRLNKKQIISKHRRVDEIHRNTMWKTYMYVTRKIFY